MVGVRDSDFSSPGLEGSLCTLKAKVIIINWGKDIILLCDCGLTRAVI